MSEAPYKQTAHLSEGHTKGITAVAFNGEGSFLATASLDGTVCLWNTSTWSLVDSYRAGKAVISLTWFAHNALVCGLEDGNMSSLVKDDEHITVSGFWAHRYPVEHIAANDNLVVSGAHEELKIWVWNTNAALSHLAKALPFRTTTGNATDDKDVGDNSECDDEGEDKGPEVLVTGVGWAQNALVATYLHHGIRLYDTEDWQLVKVIDTRGTVVSSSLSPNGGYLAATNLAVGFDIYDLQSSKVIRTFEHNIVAHGRAIPVLFVHGGHAILGGSTTGSIKIWYIDPAQQLTPMTIPQSQKVLAIAAHYDKHVDRFLIATGIMNERSSSSVIIWTSASGGQVDDEDSEDSSREDVYATQAHTFSLAVNVFYFTVILCVIAAFGLAIISKEAELLMGEEFEAFEAEYYD